MEETKLVDTYCPVCDEETKEERLCYTNSGLCSCCDKCREECFLGSL